MTPTSAKDFEQQTQLLDEASENVVYYGIPATPVDDQDDPTCVIMKVTTADGITLKQVSNGSFAQTVKWSDRAALTYKHW